MKNILKDIGTCEKDCQDKETLYDALVTVGLNTFPLPAGADKDKCQSEIIGAYPDLNQLITDLQAGAPVSTIKTDVEALMPLGPELLQDCGGITPSMNLAVSVRGYYQYTMLPSFPGDNGRLSSSDACIKDAEDAYTSALDIFNQFKSGSADVDQIVSDVETLYGDY